MKTDTFNQNLYTHIVLYALFCIFRKLTIDVKIDANFKD